MRMPRNLRFHPPRTLPTRANPKIRDLALEVLCNALPSGVMVLDAQCRLVFANREAGHLLRHWSSKRGGHPLKASSATPIPPEMISACERLRGGSAARRRPQFGGRIFLRHDKNPHLSAVIALERSPRDRRVAVFCVLMQDRLNASLVEGREDQLAMLTIAERRVAKLVADGLRNHEIARALGKSVTTVKSQLGAVFSKLAIASRTQLAALLRSA